jgi:predicted anti-sigma-YlaC factor YlaD
MKCLSIQKQIDLYLDGELSEKKIKDMESHFFSCTKCRHLKEALDNTWSVLDLWEDKEAPPYLKNRIINQIRYDERKKKESYLVRLFLAASAVIIIMITVWFSSSEVMNPVQRDENKKVVEDLSTNYVKIGNSSLPEEHMLMKMSDEEMEFYENLEIISNIEYLYLLESEPKDNQRLL